MLFVLALEVQSEAADAAAAENVGCRQLYSNGRDHAVWLLAIWCLSALPSIGMHRAAKMCGFSRELSIVLRTPREARGSASPPGTIIVASFALHMDELDRRPAIIVH